MALFFQYLQLCWFTNNPSDLHPSHSFLWKSVLFYVASGIVVEANISDPADATLEVGMRAIVALSLLSILVLVQGKKTLFTQLLNAVFMCENVIVTLGIGVEVLDVFVQQTDYEDVPIYLGVVLIIWYMAILGYIFRQMFFSRMMASLLMALGYFLLTYGGPFLVMEVL